jgi:hypothetical protein
VGRSIFPLLLGLLAGCGTLPTLSPPRTSMKLDLDKEAMRTEILKYLSIGMPIENAQRIMEDSGFKCQEAWWEGERSLACVAVCRTHHLFFSDEIHVSLYHESGQLASINVDCYSVGP